MQPADRLRVYEFHDLKLGYLADPMVSRALETRLGRFRVGDPGRCDVRFDYLVAPQDFAVPAAQDARVIYESPMGEVRYSERTDRMHIRTVWPIQAVCDPSSGKTTIAVNSEPHAHLWALSHPMLTLPLIETLKRRGRFSVHAAGVAIAGKGLVIAGSSGSGKSTLALALARAGFGFLGDDLLFLERTQAGLRALAFPEAVDLTDDTVRLFPDLNDLLEVEKEPGWPKRQLLVEGRFDTEVVWQCEPVAVLFPKVGTGGSSSLSPMNEDEALIEILPNILLTEPESSQQHLDALAELVSKRPCYRLNTGTDFDAIAVRLRELLEQTP